ncbi:MAG: tetratricopeptide repeat protein [Deltaproteobacteria bacterium]|jgi:tetratricopeptide (TPR) repeat protein|nr:tetratricopeptide repeat protein [Deltaproteobacteria bacterium]
MSKKNKFDSRAIPYLVGLIGIVALIFYWRVGVEKAPGDYNVRKGNYRLEDGQLDEAVKEFSEALGKNPEHTLAHLGLGLTYMQMGKNQEALKELNTVIKLNPDMAAAFADRGILYDRMGEHRMALADYKKAIEMDPKLLEGPGWLWRFLRNIDEKPPTIKDRAEYLEAELAKPEAERLLKVPVEDEKQRMYKIDD